MAFKINNPFGKKDERSFMPQSWRDERSQFNTYLDETMEDIEKMNDDFEERMVTQRGKEILCLNQFLLILKTKNILILCLFMIKTLIH